MASFSWRQWSAIAAGGTLFIALFFINRKPPKTDAGMPQKGGHASQSVSFDSIISQAEIQIPARIKPYIDKLKADLSSSANQATTLNLLIRTYDSVGAPIPASYYIEKLAASQNSSDLWCQAGDRYYRSAEIVNNNAHEPLIQRAISCYDNAIKIDSNNLSARVGKGQCIVQRGGSAPMEGIAMINAVLKKDSNNERAQIALGELSIESGQFPKAIYRFTKVLRIDPSYIEGYLYLAQAYENAGDKQSAIRNLEKYNTFAPDSAIKIQINNYIKKLKNETITSQNQ
jgi:tetratricopeptide (TPR) repeat protein